MARLTENLLGHQELLNSLTRSLAEGRLAHALAFVGPAGIGKRQAAWALAQFALCENPSRPCGECGSCRRVAERQSESILTIEPINGMIKLEAAHQIGEFLSLRQIGPNRWVIIDEAETLNPQATNALLKLVEEPPPNSYFIFLANDLARLLPTLRSRLQVIRFSPLPKEILKLIVPAEDWMLNSARGSVQALSRFQNEDSRELRELVCAFLSEAWSGSRASLSSLLERTRSREVALISWHFMQEFLRDWCLLESADPLHSDLKTELEKWPRLPLADRVAVWRTCQQMESELVGHVDRGLLLENLALHMRQAAASL